MPLVRVRRRSRARTYGLPIAMALAVLAALYVISASMGLHRTASQLLTAGTMAQRVNAAAPAQDPAALGYRGDPQVALGLPFETLAIQTDLGPAEAWLVPEPFQPGAPQPHMAALYVHGIAGAREDGYRFLPLLHAAGLPTLLISYRNDDNAPASPDGRFGFGLTEWPDLEAAVLALRDRGYGEVMIVADSMGGAILGQFMARSPEAVRVSAVALDSPALEFDAVLEHMARDMGLPLPGIVARSTMLLLGVTQTSDLAEASVTGRYAGFYGPLFLAHGDKDRIVPQATSRHLLDLRRVSDTAEITISLLTGADHLQSYGEDPAAFMRAFQDFLALTRRP
ncbi:alpha/beta hydrolase family protein [Seohaeicola saemankumensis]|uniref:Alpha/beta hydrolase family protein n=1 Tax=Seohaeicola saemankumensis TaxID=481181 RepID=A0ABW3THS4_9RHOB